MTDKKTKFMDQQGNRVVIWMILIAIVLSGMKIFLPVPFMHIHQQAMSAFGAEEYNKLLQLTIDAEGSYPETYNKSKLGYFKALALNKLGEYEKSQEFLATYERETTREIHKDLLRLRADNHLALNKPEEAAKLIVQIYKRDPLYSQRILVEIHSFLPKFNILALLDPKVDSMAIHIVNARKKNSRQLSSYTGIWKVGKSKAAMPMKESNFFQIGRIATKVVGEESQISGVIYSELNLKKLGYRVTAYDTKNLYLGDNLCKTHGIIRGEANKFSCMIPDSSKIGSLHFEEISFQK